MKANFFRHARNVHPNKKIEPVIVLGESADALTQNQNSNHKKVNESQKSTTFNVLPKPKKGKWIVKLERIKAIDFV